MASILTLLILISVLALSIYLSIHSYLQYRRLSQFKGPWLAAFTPLWLFDCTWKGRMYLSIADALQQYGSPVRIAPNKLVTDDPAIMRSMSAPRSPFTRGTWYNGMAIDPRLNNVLSETDEKLHNDLRAKLIRGYSGKDLPNLESDIDAQLTNLLSLTQTYAVKKQRLDLAKVIQYFTLDVLTKIAFGTPFGYLTKNEDIYDYLKMTSAFLPVLELGCNFPTVHDILFSPLMQKLGAPKGTDKVGMGAVIGVAQRVVGQRYTPQGKATTHDDMLGSFVKNGLTQSQAESESLLQILAGADSTATAIRATLLYVLTNPRVHAKLMREIDRAQWPGEIISSAEARELPYLQAVIKEGLRIFPPLVGLASKVSPPGGATVTTSEGREIFLPPGVEVSESRPMAVRRPVIYGSDAQVFRPERWIEAKAEGEHDGGRYMKMERTLELVFGTGRYGCLGKNIAMVELDKVFVSLLTVFEFGIWDPVMPVRTKCWGIHVQTDMWVSVRERTV